MPLVTKPFNFQGRTPAKASEVNANFDALFAAINGNLDGANLKPVTVDDDLQPTANTADVYRMLSWITHQIRVILGLPEWTAQPTQSLQGHRDASPIDHPDGSVTDSKIGNRAVNDAQAPSDNTGTLTDLLSELANRIKAITGAATWRDNPAATLAEARAHIDNTANPHNTTAAQVGAPTQAAFDAHHHGGNGGAPVPLGGIEAAAKTSPGGTEANRLAVTNANGRVGAAETAVSASSVRGFAIYTPSGSVLLAANATRSTDGYWATFKRFRVSGVGCVVLYFEWYTTGSSEDAPESEVSVSVNGHGIWYAHGMDGSPRILIPLGGNTEIAISNRVIWGYGSYISNARIYASVTGDPIGNAVLAN